MVIRVPIRYATKAVLGSAVRHVLGLVGPDLPVAPLADGRLRKTVTARLGRIAHNAPLRARTCELAALGRSTSEIMVALATEFGADDPDRFLAERQLSVRTVQRWRRSGGDIL